MKYKVFPVKYSWERLVRVYSLNSEIYYKKKKSQNDIKYKVLVLMRETRTLIFFKFQILLLKKSPLNERDSYAYIL